MDDVFLFHIHCINNVFMLIYTIAYMKVLSAEYKLLLVSFLRIEY